jgi:hypothetical protein
MVDVKKLSDGCDVCQRVLHVQHLSIGFNSVCFPLYILSLLWRLGQRCIFCHGQVTFGIGIARYLEYSNSMLTFKEPYILPEPRVQNHIRKTEHSGFVFN